MSVAAGQLKDGSAICGLASSVSPREREREREKLPFKRNDNLMMMEPLTNNEKDKR
jgi:hypothetical protein